jgi:putative addiction module component (TIGR02574 family)
LTWAISKDDIFRNALTLPEQDRADLIGALSDSLDAEVEENVEEPWRAEIERRARELDSGVVQSFPWEAVKARLARTSRG